MKSPKPIQNKKNPTTKKLGSLLKSKKKSKKSSKSKPKQTRTSRKPKTRSTTNLRQAKGWKDAAPKKGRERQEMLHRCGAKCFLLPHESKFPVCKMSRRCSKTEGCGCVVDRRGVVAAKFRAKQWGYHEVEKKADELLAFMDRKGVTEIRLSQGKTLESVLI